MSDSIGWFSSRGGYGGPADTAASRSSAQDPNRERKPTKIPCLVVPPSISFSAQNIKQVLTLYNPFDYFLKYKVLCTSPDSFQVWPSSGPLPPRSSLNIVLRLTNASKFKGSRKHKFLIEIHDDSYTVRGQQVIPVLKERPLVSLGPERSVEALHSPPVHSPHASSPPHPVPPNPRSFPLVIRVLPVCLGVALIAYLTSERSLLDQNSTLWAAFIIGMFTMMMQLRLMGRI